jgi:ParB family chromosome partitioning protein
MTPHQDFASPPSNETLVDLDPARIIDDAGRGDRLGSPLIGHAALVHSLRTYGQQVPILVRPHPSLPRRFQIVYGRRRWRALAELGVRVTALVRPLSDKEAILAQGQENTCRRDLSFIEKAGFAAQLDAAGHDREMIAETLSVDLPMVSRMLQVGQAVPLKVLRKIGPAPGIGRSRWLHFVKRLEAPGARTRAFAFLDTPDAVTLSSDDRFRRMLKRIASPAATAQATRPRPLADGAGQILGRIGHGRKGITLTFAGTGGFAAWIDAQAENLVRELHDRWTAERAGATPAFEDPSPK